MLGKCTDMTLHGRCRETIFPRTDEITGDVINDERCYYHDKLHRGLLTNAEAIGVIENEDE